MAMREEYAPTTSIYAMVRTAANGVEYVYDDFYGWVRRDAAGRSGSSGGADNGTYLGTLSFQAPDGTSAESMDNAISEAGGYFWLGLFQAQTSNEVGFLIRQNTETNTIHLDFFEGVASDKWLNLNNNPYGHDLPSNEMVIGFVHTHPGENSSGFSGADMYAIGEMSMGNLSWTNVPKMANFNKSNGTVSQILNYNTQVYERMYFGVIYSKGREGFSWNLGNGSRVGLYQNIYFITGRGVYTETWRNYFSKTYNVDYFKSNKKW